jgi:hypothetical protein
MRPYLRERFVCVYHSRMAVVKISRAFITCPPVRGGRMTEVPHLPAAKTYD